jgi:ferredoxin
MRYALYSFSATGNTERAVKIVEATLLSAGHAVERRPIVKGERIAGGTLPENLIVAFPVLAFSPPAFVKAFLRNLPPGRRADGSRIRAAVLAVDGGGAMGAPWRAVAILSRRGYDPAFVGCASYPENWTQFFEPLDRDEALAMTARGDAEASVFAKALAAGDASAYPAPRKPPFLSGIVPFLFGSVGRRVFGKLFIADENCDACGFCARTCPAGTILMRGRGKGRPYWKSDCENCNRCINVCPRGAIVTSIGRSIALMGAVIALARAGIAAYLSLGAPLIYSSFAGPTAAAINAAAIAIVVVASHILALVLDRILLSRVERLPGFRRFFRWSFNKGKRRYRAEGFAPRAVR